MLTFPSYHFIFYPLQMHVMQTKDLFDLYFAEKRPTFYTVFTSLDMTHCNYIACSLCRFQGQLNCMVASQRTSAADQYLHNQKTGITFLS